MSDKKLNTWNALFDLNHDGKMTPEEKAFRDYTLVNTLFDDEDADKENESGSTGCLVPFAIMVGASGAAITGVIYKVIEAVKCLYV